MLMLVKPVAVGCLLLMLAAPAALAQDGPELSVPSDRLEGALRCPPAFTHPQHEPVLLVHATGMSADLNWSWNYGRVLPAEGFDLCTIDLPGRALGDIQVSAEYVVHAVRRMRAASGRKVDIIGHSQGPLPARWAIRWWPDVRASVDDLIGLSAPNRGAALANALCVIACNAAVAQMRIGSAFVTALNADETPGAVDQTSINSRSDGVIAPTSASYLDGAANIVVQDICPGRIISHGRVLFDAVVYAIVRDALTQNGPARPARLGRLVCRGDRMPGVSLIDVLIRYAQAAARLAIGLATTAPTRGEPPLKPYARTPGQPVH